MSVAREQDDSAAEEVLGTVFTSMCDSVRGSRVGVVFVDRHGCVVPSSEIDGRDYRVGKTASEVEQEG